MNVDHESQKTPLFYRIVARCLVWGYMIGGVRFAKLHLPGLPLFPGEILLVASFLHFLIFVRRVNFLQIVAFLLLSILSLFYGATVYSDGISLNNLRDFATVYYLWFAALFLSQDGKRLVVEVRNIIMKYHFFISFCLTLKVLNLFGLFGDPSCSLGGTLILVFVVLNEARNRGIVDDLKSNFSRMICATLVFVGVARSLILAWLVALVGYLAVSKKLTPKFLSFTLISVLFFLASIVLLSQYERYLMRQYGYADSGRLTFFKPINDLYATFDPNSENYRGDTGRTAWWRLIIEENLKSPRSLLFGQGFGFDSGSLSGVSENQGNDENAGDTIEAHNCLITMFAWTGLIGAGVYSLFFFLPLGYFLCVGGLSSQLNSYRNSMVALILQVFVDAQFDNNLSVPYVAVPFYAILGSGLSFVYFGKQWERRERHEEEEELALVDLALQDDFQGDDFPNDDSSDKKSIRY